jgi:hypothetical protein
VSNGTKTSPNGAARKTLASQLDRLEEVVNGLASGLNQTIRAAVQEAVERAVVVVLTDPTLRQALHGAGANDAPPEPAPGSTRSQGRLARLGAWVGGKLRSAARACAAGLEKVRQAACMAWHAAGGTAGVMLAAAAVGAVSGACRAGCSWLAGAASRAWSWVAGNAPRAWQALRAVRPMAANAT